jgi:MarR family transcriptional regulator, organic hydroperoxide resistance regulator
VNRAALVHVEPDDELAPLDDSLDFLIRDTRRLLLKRIEARLAQYEIPLGAWFPLRILYEQDGITQRELSRRLGYLDAAAGAIVEVMEKLGLVRRKRNADDRRKINVFLTPTGRRIGRLTVHHMHEINEAIVAGFSKRDAETLRRLLQRAHVNLSQAAVDRE